MARVDPNDRRPPYVQIADDLRQAIRSGELKPGDRLSSGRVLAERYGVALMTVKNALGVLRDERLVVSSQGRGVFVVDPLPHISAAAAEPTAELSTLRTELRELEQRVAALERTALGDLRST
ncbi:GntR family transcriptional regulator [Micromonospora sp. NPDC047707]|uniref:GntR family transcriptional regulator n=1 Tax=Micromonospora sp. NPDC047707 TaxID=3154498 RepID=UPI003456E4F4